MIINKIYIIDEDISNDIFLQYWHNLQTPTDYYVNSDGVVYSCKTNRILCPNLTKKGYHKVGIYVGGAYYPVSVHKMVGLTWLRESFIPGHDINHKNGIKTDNSMSNLEWVTRSDNIRHAFATGLKKGVRGDANINTKYKDSDVKYAIKLLNETDMSVKDISEETGIPTGYLYIIFRGGSRANLTNHKTIKHNRISSHKPITRSDIDKVKLMYRTMTANEISKVLNISINRVYNIVYKK